MSLKLPPIGSPLREKFDMSDLVLAGLNPRCLPTSREVLALGRAFLAKAPDASGINYLTLRADGSIGLVCVKRASFKELFNFGDPLK